MKKTVRAALLPLLLLALLLGLAAPALAEHDHHHHHTHYSEVVLLPVVEPDKDPAEGELTITYNANGGTGSVTDEGKYAKGAKVAIKNGKGSLTPPAPKKKGAAEMAFAGWSTNKNALSPDEKYAPGRTVKLEKSLVLYAVWVQSGKERPCEIVYHYNTKGDKTKTKKFLEGQKATIAGLGDLGWKEPDDRKFLGWSSDPGAVKPEFSPGQKVYVSGEKNHLFGVWRKDGKHIRVSKYVTNKKWDKDGRLKRFKAGDKVRFNIVVSNTGTETIEKIIVYEALKGAKIKHGSGYKVDGDGDAVIHNLKKGQSVTVKASYTVKSSDLYKKHLANTAYAYYGKGEKSASARIPVRHRKSSSWTDTYVPLVTPEPTAANLTVYADRSLRQALESIRYDYMLANTGVNVNVVYEDSDELADRVQKGAYADLLITRGEAPMDALDITKGEADNPLRQDRIVSTTRTRIAADRAVLAQSRSGAARMTFLSLAADLAAGRKLAVSSPDDDAGRFARQILSAQGIDFTGLKAAGKIIEADTDDEAMGLVLSGSADAAILMGTDAAAAANLMAADVSTPAIAGEIVYPAATLKISVSQQEAGKFLYYLQSNGAKSILYGIGLNDAQTK